MRQAGLRRLPLQPARPGHERLVAAARARGPYREGPSAPGTPSLSAAHPTARVTDDFRFCAQNPDQGPADGGAIDCPALLARVVLSELEGKYVEPCGYQSSPWTPPEGLSVCTVALDGDTVIGVAVRCYD